MHALFEHCIHLTNNVGTNESMEVLPAIGKWAFDRTLLACNAVMRVGIEHKSLHLTQYRFHPTIHSTSEQHMAATVRAAPDANLGWIHFGQGLGEGNGIRDVALLQRGNDLLPWLAFFVIAVSEATLVINKTAQSELRREVIGKSIQIHLLESTPAMGHH